MDRSRSKRYLYEPDYESENLHSRTRPRYSNNSHGGGDGGRYNYANGYHRRPSFGGGGGGGGGGGRKVMDPPVMVTTSYRILCHDVKAGAVIGKSGSIIKRIRQHTGAWINVHELISGDEERIIEITDTRRRDPDGRMPSFSPAQEALSLVHDRILETEVGYGHSATFGEDEIGEYEDRGGGGNGSRVVTRLVVSRMHVGSLMGKGGKIIEQMRIETRTHIRILPRDHTLPRCVSMSEEIVQVVGDMNAVKKAIAIISSRLRESQHRDRSHFQNRVHSPDRLYPADDDFHMNGIARRSSKDGPSFGLRSSACTKSNSNSSRSSRYVIGSGSARVIDNTQSFGEDLVFRILCPIGKVDSVVGESDGIVELLQNDIGVFLDVVDPVAGSNEYIIIVSSDEDPDDELFPAQEALLHIQTRIVDIVPEKENVITTRLLLQSDEVGCLGLKDGSSLDLGDIGGANVEILPREKLPGGVSGTHEILQIVGDIKAARHALVEVTSRIRRNIYQEFLEKDAPARHPPSPADGAVEADAASNNSATSSLETQAGNNPVNSTHRIKSTAPPPRLKMKDLSPPIAEPVKQNESGRREDQPSISNRISVPFVTRSILEVVLPPHAASLVAKSRKLNLISEISGAAVKLIEDRPEATEKIIQISGTPEQAQRAQSLLQGFILSADEDGP